MHPLPGRLALDGKNHRPHVARRRRGGRSENTQNRRRQHCRTHHLRFRRSVRVANAEFRRKISGGICRACSKTPPPTPSPRLPPPPPHPTPIHHLTSTHSRPPPPKTTPETHTNQAA